MNYILAQLNRRINYLKSTGKSNELKVHYQAKFEFLLTFILGYLWNRNWERLTPDDKEYVINCILKASIGSIVAISRKLDIDNQFFGNKKLKKFYSALDEYPSLRNERIGHGYSFEDDTPTFLATLEDLLSKIEEADISFFKQDCDLVYVESESNEVYYGVSFKPDGGTYTVWTCPKAVQSFKLSSLYLTQDSSYFRLTPFIRLQEENEIFIFCSIDEKLTGRVKYNKLLKTDRAYIDIEELRSLNISDEGHKRRTSNGTVINNFDNNYKRYIDVGISKRIINFLTQNKSSVFGTLWGHGGVGKTASIQYVCEILCNKDGKDFDYIIFLSAKDRYYNYYQGRIQKLDESITSLAEIVSYTNNILFNYSSYEAEPIINYSGKLLLIIDDFETFSRVEKNNITDFVRKLNINHHKVILTTRAATLITGEEIQTTELGEEETLDFLIQSLESELPDVDFSPIIAEFKGEQYKKRIHEITSGRPLFILQFAILLGQKANLYEALKTNINSTEEAKNFLYDRIYDYLSPEAKNMFVAISLLVQEDDLTALINSLKFIVNMEEKEEQFSSALNELIKLKIIVLEDREFFKVYSPEIFKYMKVFYSEKQDEIDPLINNRYTLISANRELDTESALLETADASRMLSSEAEVENKYRYILNRKKAPIEIKLKAALNLSSYLDNYKGKADKAIKLLADYYTTFNHVPEYIKAYTNYLWAEGSIEKRIKAIDVIKIFFESKPALPTDIYFDLLGTLVGYQAIQLINEREELKELKRFGDVSSADYSKRNQGQRDRFKELFESSFRFFRRVRNMDLMELSPSSRNSVLTGLNHFVEICIRVNKREIGKEVCNKVINEMPQNFHHMFVYKLKKIELIEHPERKIDLFPPVEDTELGVKLKEAFHHKRKKPQNEKFK